MLYIKFKGGAKVVDLSRDFMRYYKDVEKSMRGFQLMLGSEKPTKEDIKVIKEIYNYDAVTILEQLKKERKARKELKVARLEVSKTRKDMESLGYDPNNRNDRLNYYAHKHMEKQAKDLTLSVLSTVMVVIAAIVSAMNL